MIEKSFSNQQVMGYLKTIYGMNVITLIPLPFGQDMHAAVYKILTEDHTPYFLKLKIHSNTVLSSTLTTFLQAKGIQQVIRAIKTIEGHLHHTINNINFTLFPFIKGKDGFNVTLSDEQWLKFGKILKQIHEINIPHSILTKLKQASYSTQYHAAIRLIYTHIETTPASDSIDSTFRMFMKHHQTTVNRLLERSEQLGQALQKQPFSYVLCHSDLHAGNILIDGNDNFFIVDWNEALMAPKERDLMFIGGGVGNVWNKPHEEALFYEGYGKVDIDYQLLTYYRMARIIEDIALFVEQVLSTTLHDKTRLEAYKHLMDQFVPCGVIEIAFNNDKDLSTSVD